MSKPTLVMCILILITEICASTSPTPQPTTLSVVWEVCDWGEEKACSNCTLGSTRAEKDVLFYEMVDAAGEVSLGSVPAGCSVVQR